MFYLDDARRRGHSCVDPLVAVVPVDQEVVDQDEDVEEGKTQL